MEPHRPVMQGLPRLALRGATVALVVFAAVALMIRIQRADETGRGAPDGTANSAARLVRPADPQSNGRRADRADRVAMPSVQPRDAQDQSRVMESSEVHPFHTEVDQLMEHAVVFSATGDQVGRLVELSGDSDPHVAGQAQAAFAYASHQLTIAEAAVPHNTRTGPLGVEHQADDIHPALQNAAISADAEPPGPIGSSEYEHAANRALDNADAGIRKDALAEASMRKDEVSVRLLTRALSDPEADIRSMAVEAFREMLEQGLGDSRSILSRLERSAGDPDPGVSETILSIIADYGDVGRTHLDSASAPTDTQ